MKVPAPGTAIRFRGGSGRNDEEVIHEGIVNGDPTIYKREQVTYVPVHLPRSNHNVMVELTNIVQDDEPA